MRRFLLLALLPMLIFSALGQNINQGNSSLEKGSKNTDQLTVSFTSLNEYVSGTTMNLNFLLTFSSSLGDMADLFRLTFPTGMTPTGGTPVLSYVNPININGQVVSWGSDHNNTGQFSIMAGTYNIFVTVQIDASLSGAQSLAYLLSPRYAGYPNVTGTVAIIQAVPVLPAPTNLNAIVFEDNNVDLTWEVESKAVFQNFNIYRNDELIATPTETTYLDEDLLNGDFEYYVTAVYDEGESEASNVETVIIEKDPWVVTPTGTIHTILVPASVVPDVFGVPLTAGDWIGVFYVNDEGMEVCGGAATISPFGNTVVSAYGDDITTTEKDGFADGEAFWWRLFDMSETIEYNAVATYDASAPDQGFFVQMGLSELTALNAEEFISNFVFKEGWNSMSSFIIPENPAMEDLFASMVDELVIFRNLTEIYWPEENFNTIGDFNNQSGYVMKLTEDKNLQIVGSGNASRELVFENAGWYYAPVLSECPVLIEELFGAQIANVIIIQELIGSSVYWPDMSIFSLQELTPGKAYSIKVSDAFTVEFPVCDLKSGVVNNEGTNQVNTVWGSVKFSPYKQITAILTSAMIDLQAGDMIGAFDENDNLFGFTTITNLTTNTAISIFGSDQVTSAENGFMNGQNVKYKLFRESSGEEFNLEVSYSENLGNTSGKFQSNSMAAIKSVALKSGIETSEQFSFDVFPNPASSEVVLKLNTSETATATLNVFEVSGRLVMEREIQKQTMLNVSELSHGVYYIKVWSQNNADVKKLVIQ
jgi:hypothetical protein